MYHYALFQSPSGETRNIHLGIDISAPVGTPVYAFANGQVFCASINSAPGDYGGTIITSHLIGDLHFWVLHGHLSHESVSRRKPGQAIGPGEVLAAIGDKQENGGWNPHLHFQISLQQPEKCDLPGTCSRRERAEALRIYPDPRLILGALY
jgi:murein DD-endopeptidase MepM/ murein hydrolase activator NlpD